MVDDKEEDFLDQAEEERFAKIDDPLIRDIAEAVVDLDEDGTEELTQQAIDEGKNPLDIVQEGLTLGVKTVGDRFGRGEVFLPELAMAADAMKAGVDLVDPLLKEMDLADEDEAGHFLVGTVDEDIHNIGKNILVTMLKANGFDVTDLGVEVPSEDFVEAVEEHDPDVLGLSALMTMTMDHQQEVIEQLEDAGVRDQVDVMVGGAPTSQEWCDEIGADAYGDSADEAVKQAKDLVA